MLQHPALAKGEFYGLNWANMQTPDYGREPGDATSGHRLYAVLRYNAQARAAVLVVCNFSTHAPAHTRVHIPRHAQEWARKLGPGFLFADLLNPAAPPIPATPEMLDTPGLPIELPPGGACILEWR